jgi:hypothetical protein
MGREHVPRLGRINEGVRLAISGWPYAPTKRLPYLTRPIYLPRIDCEKPLASSIKNIGGNFITPCYHPKLPTFSRRVFFKKLIPR